MRFTHRLIFMCAFAAAIVIAGSTPGAQDSRSAQAQLRAARQLEEVTGNLPAAIVEYRKLATNADRATAAEALLRLAGCQQQLGLAEARKTYQELLAKFADQAGVATEARRRIAELDRPSTSSGSDAPRTVWTIPERHRIVGPVSRDGRYVPFATGNGGNLAVRDLRDGTEREIPKTPAEQSAWDGGAFRVGPSVISRDGTLLASQMAVSRVGGALVNTQLTISRINEKAGERRKSVLLDGADVVPYDWSPDGRSIAIRRRLTPTTYEIGIVTLADGAFRVLKAMEWRSTTTFVGWLSPDGSRLAIEVPTNVLGSRDILVLPIDGGPEVKAVEWTGDDILLGWSPDGNSILFSSARGQGTLDVWRQRLDAKSLSSGPEMVRRNGPARPLGISLAGALFSQDDGEPGEGRCYTTPTCEVKEAVFDFDNGTFVSPPRDVSQAFVRSNESPRWSPDGTRLAYYAHRGGRDGVIVIKDVLTGESRDIPVNFFFSSGNPHRWVWAPDGESLIAQGQDADRKSSGLALHRIDLRSGKVSIILADISQMHFGYMSWAPDGKTLFYHRPSKEPPVPGKSSSPTVLVSRDTNTGIETELFRANTYPWRGSNYYEFRRDSQGGTIVDVDMATKSERELLRVYGVPSELNGYQLTSDGQAIVAPTTDLATSEGIIVLLSIADRTVRTVFRDVRGRAPVVELLARDGRSAIVSSTTQAATPAFWWVPFDGRSPKPLDEMSGVNLITLGARRQTIELHPDGRRIAFNSAHVQASPNRLMVVENVTAPIKR